jgi:hypothetical protein
MPIGNSDKKIMLGGDAQVLPDDVHRGVSPLPHRRDDRQCGRSIDGELRGRRAS